MSAPPPPRLAHYEPRTLRRKYVLALEDGPTLDLTCCHPRVRSQRSSHTRHLIANASSNPYGKGKKSFPATGSIQVESPVG